MKYEHSERGQKMRQVCRKNIKNNPRRKRLQTFSQNKRRKNIKNGTWSEYLYEVRDIYLNCPEGYEVDHIYPINSPKICGLHVPWNLQYLTRHENSRKNNRMPEEWEEIKKKRRKEMKIQEFKDKMQECRELKCYSGKKVLYTCHSISTVFDSNVRKQYAELFFYGDNWGAWCDDVVPGNRDDNMTECERRLLFLDMFEGYCIVNMEELEVEGVL